MSNTSSGDLERFDLEDCYVQSISPWDGHVISTPSSTALALWDLDHALLDLSTITLQHAMQTTARSAAVLARYVATARAVAGIAALFAERAPLEEHYFPGVTKSSKTFAGRTASFLTTLVERSKPGTKIFDDINRPTAVAAQQLWDALMQVESAHVVDDFANDSSIPASMRARGIAAHSETIAICLDMLSSTALERTAADAVHAVWDGKESSSLLAVSLAAEDSNFGRKLLVFPAAVVGNVLGPDALLLSAVKLYGQSYLSHVAANLSEAHPLRDLIASKFVKALRLPEKEQAEQLEVLERLRKLNVQIDSKRAKLDDPLIDNSARLEVEALEKQLESQHATVRNFFSKEQFGGFRLHDGAHHNVILSIFACIQFYDALRDWQGSKPGLEDDQHVIDLLSYSSSAAGGALTAADRAGAVRGVKKVALNVSQRFSKNRLLLVLGVETDKKAVIKSLSDLNKVFETAERAFAVGAAGLSIISGIVQIEEGVEADDRVTVVIGALTVASGTFIALGLMYGCAVSALAGNAFGIMGALVTVGKAASDTLKSATEKALDTLVGRLDTMRLGDAQLLALFEAGSDLASLRTAMDAVHLLEIPRDVSEIVDAPSTLPSLVQRLMALGLREEEAEAIVVNDATLRMRKYPVYTHDHAMP